jgi:hypothetical protein
MEQQFPTMNHQHGSSKSKPASGDLRVHSLRIHRLCCHPLLFLSVAKEVGLQIQEVVE